MNSQVRIEPGETFVFRQYMITDELSNTEAAAGTWASEVDLDLLTYNDFENGRTITIYSNDQYFGAVASEQGAGTTTSCGQGTSKCIGSSTPKSGSKAFFSITCGSASYFGPNQYYFSPDRDTPNDTIRPYACTNNIWSRTSWKMLGFFPLNDNVCKSLENSEYDLDFCTTEVSVLC